MKRTGYETGAALLPLILALFSANGHLVFASDAHYVGPNPDLKCDYLDDAVVSAGSTVDEFWVFSSEADHTISDPDRPPWVLGPSGPWTITETDSDPYGNPMPFTGIHFTLDPGGIPIGMEGGVFCHPTEELLPGTVAEITEFWRDSTYGIQSATATPVDFELDIPPDVLSQGHAATYQYMWDNWVPEPGSLALLATGGLTLLWRRRA